MTWSQELGSWEKKNSNRLKGEEVNENPPEEYDHQEDTSLGYEDEQIDDSEKYST